MKRSAGREKTKTRRRTAGEGMGNLTAFGETIRIALRSLRHRNFRIFTIGQSISLMGTWMQQVAVGWLVYRLTDSPLLLGLIGFVSQFPVFVLAPIAGVFADRFNRHRLVIVTQFLMFLQASVLAILVLTEHITVWQIVALMAFLGAVNGFDIPARQSFLHEMVGGKEDLPNAIALNSSMFNAARLVGPAVAGFLIAAAGEGICILLNAISYLGVLTSLFALRLPGRPSGRVRGAVFEHLAEGVRYAFHNRPIRSILTLVAIVSLAGVPFSVLLPVIATRVLGGDARLLGLLMAAVGLGALSGALWLAARQTVRGLGRVIILAAMLFGACLVGVSLSHTAWLSMLLLVGAGFGMMVQMASSNTVLQTLVDDDKRGRVMSLYSMAFIGTAPIGSLLAGAAAARIGAPATIAAGGSLSFIAALIFSRRLPELRALVRPIYVRLGILPEVASGIQAVTQEQTPDARR